MKWTFPNLRLFLSLAVITGGIYPLAVTLVSLIFFPHQAHGSLIRNERGNYRFGACRTAFYLRQIFLAPALCRRIRYHAFRSQQPLLDFREAGQNGGGAQGGSAESPQPAGENACPCGHAFASGSGLEPFISPEAAELQLNRVASTRGVPPEKVRKLVSAHFVRGGILGENVVNVMTLNAALDTLFPMSGM